MKLRKLRRALLVLTRALMIPDRSVPPPRLPFILYSCHDVDRSMIEEDQRFSPLLDGIARLYQELGYGAMHLTHPFAAFSGDAVKGRSITLNYRTLVHRLRARLRGGEAARIEFEARYYRVLLVRTAPVLVISIQPPYGLCRAARELGIPIVEALHGTSYAYDDPFLAQHMAKPDELLPDICLAFDEITQKTMDAYCKGRDFVAMRAHDPWAHAMRLKRARSGFHAATSTERRKRVLVTLQWGYDGDRDILSNIIPNGIIHPALEAGFDTPDVDFLVRAHPIQMNAPGYRHHRRYIAALSDRFSSVEWEQATSRPLPLLLDEVDAHITMSSSALGEAAIAGIPSLALCPSLHEGGAYYGLFREWGAMVTFGTLNKGDIRSWVETIPFRKESESGDCEADHLKQLAFYSMLVDKALEASTGPRR